MGFIEELRRRKLIAEEQRKKDTESAQREMSARLSRERELELQREEPIRLKEERQKRAKEQLEQSGVRDLLKKAIKIKAGIEIRDDYSFFVPIRRLGIQEGDKEGVEMDFVIRKNGNFEYGIGIHMTHEGVLTLMGKDYTEIVLNRKDWVNKATMENALLEAYSKPAVYIFSGHDSGYDRYY